MPDRSTGLTTPLRLLLATTAAFWMGVAQAQAPVVVSARGYSELRFRDFFSTPIGARGLEISDALHQADGQVVRLVGYMVQRETPVPGRFMLTPRPVAMSEHADGEADDLTLTMLLLGTHRFLTMFACFTAAVAGSAASAAPTVSRSMPRCHCATVPPAACLRCPRTPPLPRRERSAWRGPACTRSA